MSCSIDSYADFLTSPLTGPPGQPSDDGAIGKYHSDTDRTRSASPMTMPTGIRINNLLNEDDSPTITSSRSRTAGSRSARSRAEFHGNFQRIILKTRVDQAPDSSSPAPPGIGHPVLHPHNLDGVNQKRPRPQTAHQQAVNENRKARVEHILHSKLREEHARQRKKRIYGEGCLVKAARRIGELPDLYDTEDEQSWGPGGLVPNPGEEEDFGEEALFKQKVLNRALRRTNRWDDGYPDVSAIGRKARTYEDGYGDEDDRTRGLAKKRKRSNSPVLDDEGEGEGEGEGMDNEELDDLELELLGEFRGRGGKKQQHGRGNGDGDVVGLDEDLESVGEDSGSEGEDGMTEDESEEGLEDGDGIGVGTRGVRAEEMLDV